MKKHSMWIILGAILVVELVVYLLVVSPVGARISTKAAQLEDDISSLTKLERKGRDIVTPSVIDRHAATTNELEKALGSTLSFYKLADENIKKWFVDLKMSDWERQPNPAQFQTYYNDKFDALRELCKSKGITVSGKDDVRLIELTTGEKVEGKFQSESDESVKLMVEGMIRDVPKETTRSHIVVTRKLTSQEQQTVALYSRLKGALAEDETEPDNVTGGFWQTNKLSAKNLRTAQMQYWIQKIFVDALVAADGKQLVFFSFYRERQAAAGSGKKEKEKKAANAIEEHFDRIPVTVLVKLPYGAVSRMLFSLNNATVNMEFKGLKVTKPLLDEIRTEPHKDVKRSMAYTGQMTNGVMPKVMDMLDGVDFGKVPDTKKRSLPDQDELIKEPPVLVEISYDIMVMKEAQAAKQ
jgi:hypothetical protein